MSREAKTKKKIEKLGKEITITTIKNNRKIVVVGLDTDESFERVLNKINEIIDHLNE